MKSHGEVVRCEGDIITEGFLDDRLFLASEKSP